MFRALAMIFGFILGISLAIGSVAHATEGFAPTANLHAMLDDDDPNSPMSPDEGKSSPHAPLCHCHHVGVPHASSDITPDWALTVLLAASPARPLSSLRPQVPSKPPQA